MNIRDYILSLNLNGREGSRGEFSGNCCFHDDSTKSFSINLETGLWICHSSKCGLKGNFPLFYKLMENVSWREVHKQLKTPEAVGSIDEIFGVFEEDASVEKRVVKHLLPLEVFLFDCVDDEGRVFRSVLKAIIDWNLILDESDLSSLENIKNFNLRYAIGGDRRGYAIFPIYDMDGNLVTWNARNTLKNGKPKYLPPENHTLSLLLYGIHLLENPVDKLYVVEGPLDVIKLHLGFKRGGNRAVVGLNGCRSSSTQLLQLKELSELFRCEIVCLLDADAQVENNRVCMELVSMGVRARAMDIGEMGVNSPHDLSREELGKL